MAEITAIRTLKSIFEVIRVNDIEFIFPTRYHMFFLNYINPMFPGNLHKLTLCN